MAKAQHSYSCKSPGGKLDALFLSSSLAKVMLLWLTTPCSMLQIPRISPLDISRLVSRIMLRPFAFISVCRNCTSSHCEVVFSLVAVHVQLSGFRSMMIENSIDSSERHEQHSLPCCSTKPAMFMVLENWKGFNHLGQLVI